MKKNPYLISGALLLLVAIVASGCGSSTSASAPSTPSNAPGQTTTTQTNQQNSQVQHGPMATNPALQTVMEIRRLQSNSQTALTSDQKTKIKPILQNLINTSNPSQDFLQQQADAINALLTDQQKSYLKQPMTNQDRENNQNGSGQQKHSSNGTSGTQNNQKGHSFQPQDIYQQLLNSLN
ncbi:hypothetical protein DEAC_c43620 [Desulfosporosinus acididurans]|uniref:Lipoprotein n=1 Tax=Desulfosporosinus acididurans TaxID=476652 RepID=A0A0J1FJX0_9FIRM|nr:hypothetical protein [Desulfosporosinus acididurans]KLU63727.1 hypothetical protein DEAC_c43620 [Desulfosporosinus acididurans]